MLYYVIMKKNLTILATGIILIGSGVGFALSQDTNTTAEDTTNTPTTIGEQVAQQDKKLDNHEARITNVENDVKVLQDGTKIAPSTDRVTVPAVPASPAVPPEPQPESGPVKVTAYEKIPDGENTDCKLTYSDGTTYQWDWQTVEYNQGTKFTYDHGLCDQRVIGQVKN